MLQDARSFSPSESPKIFLPKPAGSGLTLVIPSLKSLKASQISTKKVKQLPSSISQSSSIYQDVDVQEKKLPRPVKLKPLKEVLAKLIAQIKRKDDYAFFLTPVNMSNVPGYSDLIKSPMDFGTMTKKVNRGKYRSLDDFSSDFKLVIKNAKTFNPPGSIYYAEADRIEAWGLDHISKAASTVIQYETDWTIDVEQDDDEQPVNVDQDEDDTRGTPMDVDGLAHDERSVSVAPSQPAQMATRRGPRVPYRREKNISSNPLAETLEADGSLPGSKDGIGAFPSGSDWAKTMLALKLKGKRYKTKKERMRIERDGPPLLPDGSLNYTEMEDPFSVLSFFVREQLSRPQLFPLYPPLYQPPPPQLNTDPLSTQTPSTPQPQPFLSLPTTSRVTSFASATALPPDHTPPSLPFLNAPKVTSNVAQPFARRRHWVINRNALSRQKGKEREDDPQDFADTPAWQTPREPSAVDFGSFSVLAGTLAEEMTRRGISSSAVGPVMEVKESLDQDVTLDLIKHSLDMEDKVKDSKAEETNGDFKSGVQAMDVTNVSTKGYWTDGRAAEAEEYIRDVVYGGVEGLAYVRSLAEFVNDSSPHEDPMNENPDRLHLPTWLIENIVDPLTEGRHSLLRETAIELNRQQNHKSAFSGDPRQGTVASQVLASLHLYPTILLSLSSLLHIRLHKIDMGSLLKAPLELFVSDEEWAGKGIKERRKQLAEVKQEDEESTAASLIRKTPEVEEPEHSWASVDADSRKGNVNGNLDYRLEPPEVLDEVLDCVADIIVELDKKTRAKKGAIDRHGVNGSASANDEADKEDQVQITIEDPALRKLRLNLLALAKRAPLDTIAQLPKDLVPPHIRHFVPTLGSSA